MEPNATPNTRSIARRNAYEQKVNAFIATHGPSFTLAQVVHVPGDGVHCQCCGYKDIVNHYHVVGSAKGERFIIGSECQELVLGLNEGHFPASKVRRMSLERLTTFAARFGLMLDLSKPLSELATDVIKARRAKANSSGWTSRRAQGKVPLPAPAAAV